MIDPHFPPPVPDYYVTRKDAEAQLRDTLVSIDDIPITLLYGESGTGKSTLATQVAHVLRDQNDFNDIFWINLSTHSLDNSLWKLFCMLNHTNTRLLKGYALWDALWSALEQQRILFIFDNVTDVGQIHEFIFGSRSPELKSRHPVILTQLRVAMDSSLDEGELRDICFELGVDYDNLPDQGKKGKIRELIKLHDRRKDMTALFMRFRQSYATEKISEWLPGHCRILAISEKLISDFLPPYHKHELLFLTKQEALDIFQQYMDPQQFSYHHDLLVEIVQQLGYHPQAILTTARAFRTGELSPETYGKPSIKTENLSTSSKEEVINTIYFDIKRLYSLLTSRFNEEELQTFCYFNYQQVYEQFSSGMTKTKMIFMLIDYCKNRNALKDLARLLKQERSDLFD